MLLQKISLFHSKREFFLFIGICLFIAFYSLLIEYNNYKQLTQFDSALVDATIIKQYQKTKLTKKGNQKTYQVLKLKSDKGFSFYTTVSKNFPNNNGNRIKLEIWIGKISFYEYINGFFAYNKIILIDDSPPLKKQLNLTIDSQHENQNISAIYKALYTATPLNYQLQSTFSTLGISHLFAISGFHLGVLSGLLFFLLKYPYSFLQNRYFPYRNSKRDIFFIVASVLLFYLLFLDSPDSLLRAFTMLVVGFFLYDRAIKIISMQTLFLTAILLLAFFPKLLFSLGFWLSISGVFYIFLFLIHFKYLSPIKQFILLPIWVYILMLPYSLVLFGNFSIYHPLSIIWTSLFTLFYPLSIFLHLANLGNLLDSLLENLIILGDKSIFVTIGVNFLVFHIFFSFLSIWRKRFLVLLLFFSSSILIYAINQIT